MAAVPIELVSLTNQLPSHAFHQQAEHLAHAPFLVAMRLQVRRPSLQIHPFVYLQHHRLVAERARWGLRVAVGVVDADGIAVVLVEVDGIVEQRLVGSRPVVVEADAHVHVAHVIPKGTLDVIVCAAKIRVFRDIG